MEFIACFGQALMGIVFIMTAAIDIKGYKPLLGLMRKKGIPLSAALLPAAISLKVLGGVALILDVYVGLASLLLAVFVLIANIVFHPFWKLKDMERVKEYNQFLTYLLVIAGLLVLSNF